MTGGETYNYAAILLLLLVKLRSVPHIIYYDIACRFAPWFSKLLPVLPLNGTPAARAGVLAALTAMQMAVGDFHVQMHNAACRAAWSFRSCLDSTRYKDCMAAAGEPTEQYWAAFGGGSLLRLKYMSLENFTLVLESIFQTVNRANDARLASWLVDRIRTLLVELQHVDTALASLRVLFKKRGRVRRPAAAAMCSNAARARASAGHAYGRAPVSVCRPTSEARMRRSRRRRDSSCVRSSSSPSPAARSTTTTTRRAAPCRSTSRCRPRTPLPGRTGPRRRWNVP